jgi:hypothetical protein
MSDRDRLERLIEIAGMLNLVAKADQSSESMRRCTRPAPYWAY